MAGTGSRWREQLKSPRWQRRRLQIMQRDRFACQHCGDTESELHVHHLRYSGGRAPWEYGDDELVTLCGACHEDIHALQDDLANALLTLRARDPALLGIAASVLTGWASRFAGLASLKAGAGHRPEAFQFGAALGQLQLLLPEDPRLLRQFLEVVLRQPAGELVDAVQEMVEIQLDRRRGAGNMANAALGPTRETW